MVPSMMLTTLQREREVELQRLAMRRPLQQERSARMWGRKERLVALVAVYRSLLTSLRTLAGPRKVTVEAPVFR